LGESGRAAAWADVCRAVGRSDHSSVESSTCVQVRP
jgi:hypothetical protein